MAFFINPQETSSYKSHPQNCVVKCTNTCHMYVLFQLLYAHYTHNNNLYYTKQSVGLNKNKLKKKKS